MTGLAPSAFGRWNNAVKDLPDADLKRFPVEQVSWEDCQLFIERMNEKEKESGCVNRLPKEAEWEYACRGGPADKLDSAFDFNFVKPTNTLLPGQANIAPATGKGLQRTYPVGSYEPNVLGLYDMHGNVHEWCDDAWTDTNGVRLPINRGGNWPSPSSRSQAAHRDAAPPSYRETALGLRLVRVPSPASR